MKERDVESVEVAILNVKETATVDRFDFFSFIHIYSAFNLAMKAEKIELSCTSRVAPESVINQHLAYAIGSIFSSVAFLEATINEFFLLANKFLERGMLDDALKQLPLTVVDSMAEIWGAQLKKSRSEVCEWDKQNNRVIKTHRGLLIFLGLNDVKPYVGGDNGWSTFNKFQLALYLASRGKFDKQHSPWKEAFLLTRLRNHLVHYKPEFIRFESPSGVYQAELVETDELIHTLEQANCCNPLLPGKGSFLNILGAKCAFFGVDSSLQLVRDFARRMPIELNVNIRNLALKRCIL